MVLNISFVLGILVVSFGTAEVNLTCSPGEVSKSFTFTCFVNENAAYIYWRKDGEIIADCIGNDCTLRQDPPMYAVSRSDQNYSLTILSVTVHSNGAYLCEASTVGISTTAGDFNKSTCNFTVFAKPERIICQGAEFQSQTNEVSVVCTAQKVYPSPNCQFTWFLNDTQNHAVPESFITYDNIVPTGNYDFFKAKCTVKLQAQNFPVGTYQFQVRVYPNVTGRDTDIAYGIDSSRTSPQSVAIPSFKMECPDTYVEEGKNFSCTCRETANFFTLSTTTLSYGPTRNSSTQNVTGSFIANRNIVDLTCEAQLPGGTKNRITQTLQVAFGPSILSFEANSNSQHIIVERNSIVSFSCQAEGNPSPRLSLRKNGAQPEKSSDPTHSIFDQTLTYRKIMAECLDTGVYMCLAEGGQTTTYKTVVVYVKCKPDFRNPDNLIQIHQVRVNGTVSINVPIFGYPEPNVTLTSTKYALSADDYNLTYLQQEPPYGNVSLTVNIKNSSYFQNYSLIINNTEGPLNYSFQIEDGDPVNPDAVKDDPHGPDVGAIVGGIVAAVLVIVIIFVIVIFLKRKGAPCNRNQQNGKTVVNTPYGSNSSEKLRQVQDPETSHYEEIINVQSDTPDSSVYYTNQIIPNIQEEEVQYENTICSL